MDSLTKGSKIIARDCINQPLIRLLWEIGDRCVYICSVEQYEDLLSGDASAPAIGFPIEDVYQFDASVEDMMNSESFDWSKFSKLVTV